MTLRRNEDAFGLLGGGWLVVVGILAAATLSACNRQGALEEQLNDARAEWTARLSALRVRQSTLAAESVQSPTPSGVAHLTDAQVIARRLQVMEVSGQQAVADVNRQIEDEIRTIREAGNPWDELLEARSRMAEYFAAQEAMLLAAQGAITAAASRGAQ